MALTRSCILKKRTIMVHQRVLDITVNICNQLVKIHASAFQVFTDIPMDVASGSMIIITARLFMQNPWQPLHVEKNIHGMNIMVQENPFSTLNVTVRIQLFIWRKLTIMDLQTVQVIIVTICNQLAKILASVFPVLSDTLTDGVSGSTTIITAKQCMQNHKLLSLNAVKKIMNISGKENQSSTLIVTDPTRLCIWRKHTIMVLQTVLDITVNICNQLVKILASVFQVSTDIQMDVASGSMTIITVKQSMLNLLLYAQLKMSVDVNPVLLDTLIRKRAIPGVLKSVPHLKFLNVAIMNNGMNVELVKRLNAVKAKTVVAILFLVQLNANLDVNVPKDMSETKKMFV